MRGHPRTGMVRRTPGCASILDLWSSLLGQLELDDPSLKMPQFGYQGRTGSHTEKQVEFHNILYECVLEAMKNVLGEAGTRAVVFNLKLTREGLSPDEFHKNLFAIFKNGSVILEKMIAKELFEKCGLIYRSSEDFDFERCVDVAREALVSHGEGMRI